MRKIGFRWIAFFIILTITSLSVAACDSDTEKKVDLEAPDSSLPQAPLEEDTLTIYLKDYKEDVPYVQEIFAGLSQRAKKDLNIKLVFKTVSAEPPVTDGIYYRIIKKTIDSGQPCDMFEAPDGSGSNFKQFADEGILMDITGLFPRYAPNYYNKYSRDDLASCTVNGKLYGIPARSVRPQRLCAIVCENYMTKYNIPEIKTLEDLEGYLKIVKKNEPKIIPASDIIHYFFQLLQFHGYVTISDGLQIGYKKDVFPIELVDLCQTPEFELESQRIASWYTLGYLMPYQNLSSTERWEEHMKTMEVVPVNSMGQIYRTIYAGRIASTIGTAGVANAINEQAKRLGLSDWRYKAYPLYPDRITPKEKQEPTCLLFNAKSSNADSAIMFLEWLQSSQENYDLMRLGIKGKHYELYGEQYDYINQYKFDIRFYSSMSELFENNEFERTHISSDPDFKIRVEEVERNIERTVSEGFSTDSEKLMDAAFNLYLEARGGSSLISTIENGSFSGDTLKKHIEKRKKNGIEAVIKQLQEQLDVWWAENKK